MKKLLMVFTMLMAASVFADTWTDPATGIEWKYTVKNGKATVGTDLCPWNETAISHSTTGAITIPSMLGGCPVTCVGEYAFYACTGLKSVTIPSSVTHIGDMAFCGCSGLTSVTMSSGLTSIGGSAFSGCSGLTSVTIPSRVTSIGWCAFEGCEGLTSVTIPESVTSIICNPFLNCDGLVSINVDKNNVYYSSQGGVLFNKEKSELLGFPKAKRGAYVIPASVTSIGADAFWDCRGLTSVTIPEGVTSICAGAFLGCEGLTSVTIPSSVTSIGVEYVVQDEELGDDGIIRSTICRCPAFACCSKLTIKVEEGNPNYKSVNGLLLTKDGTQLLIGVNGNVTIPSSVTSIGEFAFEGCERLTSVTIPEGVTSIGERAFFRCSGLTNVTIPSSVTSIGGMAFHGCDALRTVYVDKGDTNRVKKMLEESWFDTSKVKFVEGTAPAPDPEPDPDPESEPEPEVEEAFKVAHTFNGLVTDGFGMCGMIQVATAKKSAKGDVKVSGFVMLEDGKKQTLKAVSGKVSGGAVEVATKAGKTSLSLTITDDGFTGTLGDMTVASADIGEETGIVSGTLKMSYFDAKTGKVKTKSITIKGLANGDAADISATVKGQGEKFFEAKIVE